MYRAAYLHSEWGIKFHKPNNCIMFLLADSLLHLLLNHLCKLLLGFCQDLQSEHGSASFCDYAGASPHVRQTNHRHVHPALLFTLFDGAVLVGFAILLF